MILLEKRCINCGGFIEINENKEIVKCLYCGSRYIIKNDKIKTDQINQGQNDQFTPNDKPQPETGQTDQKAQANQKIQQTSYKNKLFTWKL